MFELDEAAYRPPPGTGAVKEPLPRDITKKFKKDLPNGRSKKGVPTFDRWFCQIFPKDITYPSWRYLSKTATDIANICRAKGSHANAVQGKSQKNAVPFEFTFSEAVNVFGITRPTFQNAIAQLIEIGFIRRTKIGGVLDGKGVNAQYQLSDEWKTWEPPQRKHENIQKAREAKAAKKQAAKKQNPSKEVLTAIGKGSLTGEG